MASQAATRGAAWALQSVKHIVAVASGKGGVGKSTVAANVAAAMAVRHDGARIGLLDADIHGPSIATMMGLNGTPHIVEGEMGASMQPMMSHGVACMSIACLVPDSAAVAWRGPMVQKALDKLMFGTAWGALDVLFVDMPPGTGDIHISTAQRAQLSGAIIVSTPQDVALIDCKRGIDMFHKLNVPVLGVVENMSWHVCAACGATSHVFGSDGAARMAASLHVDLLGKVPLETSIREQGDRGAPVVVARPDSAQAAAFYDIAAAVWTKLFKLPSPRVHT